MRHRRHDFGTQALLLARHSFLWRLTPNCDEDWLDGSRIAAICSVSQHALNEFCSS